MRRLWLLALLVFFLAVESQAQTGGYIDLSLQGGGDWAGLDGEWKYHSGDDPSWADAALDDADWDLVRPLIRSGELPGQGWPGIGWFRLHVQLDSTFTERPLALMHRQFGASEIYLDGLLIQRYGRIGPDAEGEDTTMERIPRLLGRLAPGPHVVAVRHANFSAAALHRTGKAAGFSLSLGPWEKAMRYALETTDRYRTYQAAFAGALAAFALFHLLLFALYPQIRRNLYFAVLLSLVAVMVLANFQIRFVADLEEYTQIERLWRLSLLAATLAGMRVCYSFIYARLPRHFWFFASAAGALGLLSLYRLDFLSWIYAFVLMAFVDMLRLMLRAPRRWKRILGRISRDELHWVWTVLAGMAGLMLTTTYQILINIGLLPPPAGFAYPYLVGIVLFMIPVSVAYLSHDFAQVHRQLEARVTERTRQLEMAKKTADAASRAKSLFLANISHEIRTPMNAILGYAQILRRDAALPAAYRQAVDTIQSSGDHLLDLINDVLDLSKIEAGRHELHLAPFDLSHLVGGLEAMFETRSNLKGIAWRLCWPRQDAVWVEGDGSKLTQVLVNLLGNAVKFTQEGTVELRVEEAGADRYRFVVVDTGPGIPADERETLFEAFQQGKTGESHGGTGLGLAIARSYIELMGGRLDVDSESHIDRGSRFGFEIELPAAALAGSQMPAEDWSTVQHLAANVRVTALVLDDDVASSAVLCRALADVGVQVEAVTDANLVLERLEAEVPDIVFLDLFLPDMDGYATLECINARPALAGVRRVAVSAAVLGDEHGRATAAGFDYFIGKPFRFAEVYSCLAHLLGVEFVYEDIVTGQMAEQVDWSKVEADPELVRRLCEAARCRQVTRMESCFRQLEAQGGATAHLAEHLRSLRRDYDMEAIVKLLEGMEYA
jgi:signal transduction histidine kinase/CheY-like chemotaxis protein